MSWYVAKIVFRIRPASPCTLAQFDEQLHLISADSLDEAFFKSRLLGIQEEDDGLGETRKNVQWEFVNISELFPLNELVDGTEVYSRIHETAEAAAYINLVHRKAADLAAA
jgi:hypothetical protein